MCTRLLSLYLALILHTGFSIAWENDDYSDESSETAVYHRNKPESENKIRYCGQTYLDENSGRIINGEEADQRQFPWMVKLMMHDFFFCGGSLISRNYVVTAGHCVASHINGTSELPRKLRGRKKNYTVMRPSDAMRVVLGSKYLDDSRPVKETKVLEIMLHPDYDVFVNRKYMMQTNDIAVLRIRPVKFNKYISPICLPKSGETVPDGTLMTIAGWGLVEEGTADSDGETEGVSPTTLMKNTMQKLSWRQCRNNPKSGPFLSPVNDLTDDKIICMIGNDTDACQGDSGGGVVERTPRGSVLQGIVSWGIGCNRPHFPSAYTRVASYMKFILKHTKGTRFLPMMPGGDSWKKYSRKRRRTARQHLPKPTKKPETPSAFSSWIHYFTG